MITRETKRVRHIPTGRLATVTYVTMREPEYREVKEVSVRFDDLSHVESYSGTLLPAEQLEPVEEGA